MDKQTYEELKKRMQSLHFICDRYDGSESVTSTLMKLDELIESQKPLEIVEGGLYIQLKVICAGMQNDKYINYKRLHPTMNESDLPIRLEVLQVNTQSVYFRFVNGDNNIFIVPLDQFNQHNFMKVEDK